jgi:hypothetical protein
MDPIEQKQEYFRLLNIELSHLMELLSKSSTHMDAILSVSGKLGQTISPKILGISKDIQEIKENTLHILHELKEL